MTQGLEHGRSLGRVTVSVAAADLAGDYPAVQCTPPDGRYTIDILARLGEAFRFEDLEADDVMVEGVRARVATPRMPSCA